MKLLVRLALLVVLLLVLAAGAGVLMAGRLARTAVEKGGTYALGVPTSLGGARLGLFSGELGLTGLEVRNPEGFEREHFLAMKEAQLEVTLASLRSDRVEAPLLLLDGVEISLERRDGRTNYGAILEHLEQLGGGEPGEAPEGGEEPPRAPPREDEPKKQFLVHEVVLRDIVAHVDLLPAGGEWTRTSVRLPELRLQNVGNDSESIAELVRQVVTALVAAVVEAGGADIPAEMLKDLEGRLAGLSTEAFRFSDETLSRLGDAAGQLSEQLGGDAGKLIEEAGGRLEEAGKELEKGLEGLLKRD